MSGNELSEARSSGADWFLGNAEEQHAANPRSFFIPSRDERESLGPGRLIRLSFLLRTPTEEQPSAERMWVQVARRLQDGSYIGNLDNQPAAIEDLAPGDLIHFGPQHVISADDPRWRPFEQKLAFASRRLIEDEALEPHYVCHDPTDEERPPRPDGTRASGWQLLVGDETDAELNDSTNLLVPNLAWLMERYAAFGDLVFSGAREGEWELDAAQGRYRELP